MQMVELPTPRLLPCHAARNVIYLSIMLPEKGMACKAGISTAQQMGNGLLAEKAGSLPLKLAQKDIPNKFIYRICP